MDENRGGNEISRSVGKRIRMLRQLKGYNQATVARMLKLSIPAFSKVETGITDINISRLIQIAALFKVRAERLLFDDGDTVRVNVQEYEELKERLRIMEGEVLEL